MQVERLTLQVSVLQDAVMDSETRASSSSSRSQVIFTEAEQQAELQRLCATQLQRLQNALLLVSAVHDRWSLWQLMRGFGSWAQLTNRKRALTSLQTGQLSQLRRRKLWNLHQRQLAYFEVWRRDASSSATHGAHSRIVVSMTNRFLMTKAVRNCFSRWRVVVISKLRSVSVPSLLSGIC